MSETKKKVVLVEDDPAILDIYETMIKKAGYEVEVCSSGQEAIKKMQSVQAGEASRPDIVLLDLILPDVNGIEVLKEVRKHQATKDTIVFILSNQGGVELEGQEVKPDKFIVKANITPTELIEVIKQALN